MHFDAWSMAIGVVLGGLGSLLSSGWFFKGGWDWIDIRISKKRRAELPLDLDAIRRRGGA